MKINLYKILNVLFILFVGHTVNAAEPVEKNFSIPRGLAMGITHQSYDYASLENSSPEVAMDYTQVKVPVGKFNALGQILVPSISLERTVFKFRNDVAEDQTLYTLKSQLMLIEKQDDKWMRILQVTPSIHSDMDTVDSDAFSLMGLAIWRYQSTDRSAWTMGFGFNRLFGEYQPIPLLSYQYQATNRLQLDIGFPITKAEYLWQSNWTGFVSFAPAGGNWRMKTQNDDKLNVAYSSWLFNTGVRYQFKPKMWATLALTQSIGRKLNLDDSDSTREVDVADSGAIMLSIGFHP
jgi:hypothetical protein